MRLQTQLFIVEVLTCARCKYFHASCEIIVILSRRRHMSLSPWFTSLIIRSNLVSGARRAMELTSHAQNGF